MRTFETQADFEPYWNGTNVPTKPIGIRKEDSAFIVYFTATWCGACKRLDLDMIESIAKNVGIPIWKVEQTVNDFTAGFCDVSSLPTFLLIKPKKIVSKIAISNTENVVAWIKSFDLKKK
jgi:thiol-disulfide isomerase/thioredoxin